jgi:hypothetical protein
MDTFYAQAMAVDSEGDPMVPILVDQAREGQVVFVARETGYQYVYLPDSDRVKLTPEELASIGADMFTRYPTKTAAIVAAVNRLNGVVNLGYRTTELFMNDASERLEDIPPGR